MIKKNDRLEIRISRKAKLALKKYAELKGLQPSKIISNHIAKLTGVK